MRQVLESLQVAQEEGQLMHSGEARYMPGSQARQAVIAPFDIEQLTHPMESRLH